MFVGWSVLTAQEAQMAASDPELVGAVVSSLEFIVGTVIGAVAEGWYWLARRLGWRT